METNNQDITDTEILDWLDRDELNVTECLTHIKHLGLNMRGAARHAISARIRAGTYDRCRIGKPVELWATVIFDDGTRLSRVVESPKEIPRLGDEYYGRKVVETILEQLN